MVTESPACVGPAAVEGSSVGGGIGPGRTEARAVHGTNASAFNAFRLCRIFVSGTLPPGNVPEDVRHGASPLFSLFVQLL